MYVRREDEKERRTVRMMVAAVREGTAQQQWKSRDRRAQYKGPSPKARPLNDETAMEWGELIECFYCGKKGHMKRNCRKKMADEKMFKAE